MKMTEGHKEIHSMVVEGKITDVCFYPVFTIDNGQCSLAYLRLFADGTFELKAKRYSINEIDDLIEKGVVVTTLPDGIELLINELSWFQVNDVISIVEEDELAKEMLDIVAELNNEETSSDICRSIFDEYQQNPSEELRLELKEAYEEIPKQLHAWLFGFPQKDTPVLKAIYGESFMDKG